MILCLIFQHFIFFLSFLFLLYLRRFASFFLLLYACVFGFDYNSASLVFILVFSFLYFFFFKFCLEQNQIVLLSTIIIIIVIICLFRGMYCAAKHENHWHHNAAKKEKVPKHFQSSVFANYVFCMYADCRANRTYTLFEHERAIQRNVSRIK